MATRVLIADDHAIVRAGLRALVRSEGVNACDVDGGGRLELVGEASGGAEAAGAGRESQRPISLSLT